MIVIEHENSPCEIGTTVVEEEIHSVPAEYSLDIDIAKDATSFKKDIQRIENIIMHTQKHKQGNIIPFYNY